MVCDYFKISGTGEAPFDFNNLLRVQLKNDSVQPNGTKYFSLYDKESRRRCFGTFVQQGTPLLCGIKSISWHCTCRIWCRKENRPVRFDRPKRTHRKRKTNMIEKNRRSTFGFVNREGPALEDLDVKWPRYDVIVSPDSSNLNQKRRVQVMSLVVLWSKEKRWKV